MLRIARAMANSYRVVAESICNHLGVRCDIRPVDRWFLTNVDLFIGSASDVPIREFLARNSKVLYITIEGKYIHERHVSTVRKICYEKPCIAVTKFGRAIFEEHGIPVADVMYHPLPKIDERLVERLRNQPRPFEVVYLNNRYLLFPNRQECERKGWHFWPHVYSNFNAIGFSNSFETAGVVKFSTPEIADVYKLLALGSVYSNLSKSEGFGLNPVMSLYVGTKVVTWDMPVTSELLGGIDGVYMVPAPYSFKCQVNRFMHGVADVEIEHRWGDMDQFVQAVRYALATSTYIDYAEVESRFGGHVTKVIEGYISRR